MSTVPSSILKSAEANAAKDVYMKIVEGLELDSIQIDSNVAGAGRTAVTSTSIGTLDPYRKCKDGERTNHLVRLAGMWISKGEPLERVVELALGWNSNNDPPLPDDKVQKTCASIFETDRRNHPEGHHRGAAPAEPTTPLFDLATASVARMLDTSPPPREWLIEKMLPLDIVAMIVGQGGNSKSMFALQLGISVVTGEPFLGDRTMPEPGAALLLFAEDDVNEIHRRLDAAVRPIRLKDAKLVDVVKERLFIKSMVAVSNLMTTSHRGEVTATAYVDQLILTARQIPNLQLVVIDPVSRFRGGDENTAQDTTRFVEQLERLRAALGVTVVVLHHSNKGSAQADETTQGASRGSSAMTDGVRWQMNLNRPTKKEAAALGIEETRRQNFVIATITKNNYGPPQEPMLLHRGDDGILEFVSAAARATNRMKTLIDIVKSEAAKGMEYSASSFEDTFGGEKGTLNLGKNSVRTLIKKAVAEGYLSKDKHKSRLKVGPKVLV